jgi:hypothetical protein
MLVVLNRLMDQRYGLTEEERRDFRQLYGDPWFMVQQLLGHASRETTVNWYLAPVADLELRSMLAGVGEPAAAPMPELDAVFGWQLSLLGPVAIVGLDENPGRSAGPSRDQADAILRRIASAP